MKNKFLTGIAYVLVYVVIYLFWSAIFVALFHIPFLKITDVLMYRGIVYIIGCSICAGGTMYLAGRKLKHIFGQELRINVKDIIMMVIIFCCINMTLFTLIPVTVERSITVFMLSYMEETNTGYTQKEISQIFSDTYVYEFEAFDKRFDEQGITGTIEADEEGYWHLTDKGKMIVGLFRLSQFLFDTDNRITYPVTYNN